MTPDFKTKMIEAMKIHIDNLDDENSWDYEEEDVANAFIAGAEWAVKQLAEKQ
jgi:hypothetical protein